jgi:hypothetical protein
LDEFLKTFLETKEEKSQKNNRKGFYKQWKIFIVEEFEFNSFL